MTPEQAHQALSQSTKADVGKFYGDKAHLALGAGLIFERILSPLFSNDENLFLTVRQPVYVLTHECDVDPDNSRPFNDTVAYCPVIPLAAFVRRFSEKWPDDEKMSKFLGNVAAREVGRVVYLPPGPGLLGLGALIYLNSINSTHVSAFSDQQPVAALSEYGLREVDLAVRNSLLREKAESLSFSPRITE